MIYNGAFDNRANKTKDFKWNEVFVSGVVTFPERASIGYTVRHQDGSGSCVAQTVAKMLEVWDFKHDNTPTVYSATPIYTIRSNKPAPGMIGVEALNHPIKNGVWLESVCPSQQMSDFAMDSSNIPVTSQKERPSAFLIMPVDFYSVASEVDRSGAVMLWVKCSAEEWSTIVPTGNSDSEAIRHSITVVDKISWKGEEYLIIEDSWGQLVKNSEIPIQEGQRAITKKFFDKHCFFTACFTSFSFDDVVKPKHTWKTIMKYGQTSNDIKKLQEVLIYEKLFPSNVGATGYFGGITARALVKWQMKYGFYSFANETNMAKVQAGPRTIEKLNSLYTQ